MAQNGIFTSSLQSKARRLLEACRKKEIMLATAESCTGGLVAALLTEIPGSSDVFDRAFITYSNEAKTEMLGVSVALIKRHGAVSEEVVQAMAAGALKHSRAQLALAITGIAGPGGGSTTKPVGLVYIAVAESKGKVQVKQFHLKGGRDAVRMSAVKEALNCFKEY